ncbi:MAG: sulfurtransferase [Anaerolineae bacterium]|nr:sulfurtransferase [Anaerolineae bacterium]NUQ03183.1 sulfurtransferase [Anaerolineae bacterium]
MSQTSPLSVVGSLLIESEWLVAHLDAENLRIVDVRLAESYVDGHIPNAVHLDLNALRAERDGIEGMLITPESFSRIVGQMGIDADTTVVLYDDHHGMPAARAAWSLLRYGHANLALLDGGWDAWENGAFPTTQDVPFIAPHRFGVVQAELYGADFLWVRAHLNHPQVTLLDVRSSAEYDKGHLPGALLWDWQNGADESSTFRSVSELRASLSAAGVTPDHEIVTYCQSGVRASHTFLLLKHLGFERVRMYDGSWAEWSSRGSEVERS